MLVVLLAACSSTATEPRDTPLPPLPEVVTVSTSTVAVTVPLAVAAPPTAPPTSACFCDVYGVPLDPEATFTVPAVPTTPPPSTAAPRPTAPPPQEPPTTVCHRKNPKKCKP